MLKLHSSWEMPFVAELGDVVQTSGEVTFEWKLRDFFSLSDKTDDFYHSPVFSFADAWWCLRLYPNGETNKSTTDYVDLYLMRADYGPPKTVYYTLYIIGSEGDEESKETEFEFTENEIGHGRPRFLLRSELQDQASTLMPDKILTIVCRLKCRDPEVVKVSRISRVCEVSSTMKTILEEGKRSDFTLKLRDREWPVHKVILESRCEYFANMFRHDWIENTVGEVKFEDMDEDALDSVLGFIYTGGVSDMSTENVCEIYSAAHKFLLENLKALCIEYMRGNMCAALVCKALVVAGTYEEKDLYESVVEHFMREACIFSSKEWKELKKDHPSIAMELLEETTQKGMKKGAKK